MTSLSDLVTNRMGFGAMQLAGPGVFGPPKDRDEAIRVLRRAVELGVDHIDTSQFYGPDVVNELIREALHPYPEGLRLVSKVGARRDEQGGWLPAHSPAELRDAVEDNLRTLGAERLALVNLRWMGEGDLAEQLGTMADLRDEGKLEQVGISNVEAAEAEQALELTDVACVQNSYSILDRRHEDVLQLCLQRGIAFVPFFPLGSAFTGGPAKLAADEHVAAVAKTHGATPSQVALAWLLHHAGNVLLIPGTSSVGHLEENVAAGELALDSDELERLDRVEEVGDPMESVQH